MQDTHLLVWHSLLHTRQRPHLPLIVIEIFACAAGNEWCKTYSESRVVGGDTLHSQSRKEAIVGTSERSIKLIQTLIKENEWGHKSGLAECC